MVASGDFQPKDYQYPSLYTNLLASIYSLFHVKTEYAYYLIGCFISALAGSALVVAVFFMARLFCSNFGALFASCLSVFCITSITFSRIPAPDILMVFFMTAAIYTMLHERISIKHFVLAGVFAGLSAGSKFTGLYLILWFPVSAWIVDRPKSITKVLGHLFVTYLAFAVTFLLTTPWFLPMLNLYIQRMLGEFKIQQYGQVGAVQGGYLDYFFSSTATWGQPWLGTSFITNLGIPLTLAGAIAILWGLSKRGNPRVFLITVYIMVYIFLISGPGRLKAFRFVFPILPLLYVLIGCFIEKSLINTLKRYRTILGLALAASLLAFPALKTIKYLRATINLTTNEIAQEWIAQNISPGTKVFRGPLYLTHINQLPLKFLLLKNVGGRLYRLPEEIGPNPERSPIYYPELIDEFRNYGVQYLIMNSYFDDAFSPVPENIVFFPRSVKDYQMFLKRLNSEAHLAYSVKGWSEHRIGPDIAVYRLE
ncbi:MAG: hypothetical protein A2Y97_06175 [Nitrospirae bacterium RBG_13_39_12]|nr:MAG: hypothetical protein A2Y97_06175 [Nitrospirae bacterium RBG_13_39_12]